MENIAIRDPNSQPDNRCTLDFYDKDTAVGRLTWKDGIFEFEGNASESAKILFSHLNQVLGLYPQ